jgi:hypothetical protein
MRSLQLERRPMTHLDGYYIVTQMWTIQNQTGLVRISTRRLVLGWVDLQDD